MSARAASTVLTLAVAVVTIVGCQKGTTKSAATARSTATTTSAPGLTVPTTSVPMQPRLPLCPRYGPATALACVDLDGRVVYPSMTTTTTCGAAQYSANGTCDWYPPPVCGAHQHTVGYQCYDDPGYRNGVPQTEPTYRTTTTTYWTSPTTTYGYGYPTTTSPYGYSTPPSTSTVCYPSLGFCSTYTP